MNSNISCEDLFFHDLKAYNSTNFRLLASIEPTEPNPKLHKSFSSVVTRYFIFREKHPDISDTEMRKLYYKLRIDMIAKYFSEYPASSVDDLKLFQHELREYISQHSEVVSEDECTA